MYTYSMTMHKQAVGVLGASGYTGRELMTVLARHGGVEVRFATSDSEAGRPSGIPNLPLVPLESADPGSVDVLFLCLPHGESVPWVDRMRGSRVRVIDLTADHRPGSGREAGVVYGLPELYAEPISSADVVANPGCYPTGVLLSVTPLCRGGLLDASRPVVVNAASGVTGAGRAPKRELLFGEVFGDYRAYGLGNNHRHLLEMRATLPGLELLFIPHLLPVARGILETIVISVAEGVRAADVRAAWKAAYRGSAAVRVVDDGVPALADVVGTDVLALGAADNVGLRGPVVTVVAALDNLGKGAAGQAVQNMNLMLGFEQATGLRC
jgi:N-acetyl-gamma-glutamyl-phosphate reductase